MELYGLPEGTFQSMWNNKNPAGIVVVLETRLFQPKPPGRPCGGHLDSTGCVYTCHVVLELWLVSYYLQLAFVPLKPSFLAHSVSMQPVFLVLLYTAGS